jgi:uncharacterized small protein (DUF1192 family)
MIITEEMYDEFVESAEDHTILWTDTLALIGVTVGDVPDVDVIEAQAAEIARLRAGIAAAKASGAAMQNTANFDQRKYYIGLGWECAGEWLEKLAQEAQETQP